MARRDRVRLFADAALAGCVRHHTPSAGAIVLDGVYTRDAAGRITVINGEALGDTPARTTGPTPTTVTTGCCSANNAGVNALDESFTYQANGNLAHAHAAGRHLHLSQPARCRPHAPTKLGPPPSATTPMAT